MIRSAKIGAVMASSADRAADRAATTPASLSSACAWFFFVAAETCISCDGMPSTLSGSVSISTPSSAARIASTSAPATRPGSTVRRDATSKGAGHATSPSAYAMLPPVASSNVPFRV